MANVITGNLCKSLRACGLPKKQTLQILNEVQKWINSNGLEWTNSRIKALRQWYETSLTGEPKPPEWFKHSDTGMPLGIWRWVFNLPVAKALGVLSLNTLFEEKELSSAQKEKFLHALKGNGNQNLEQVKVWGRELEVVGELLYEQHILKLPGHVIDSHVITDSSGMVRISPRRSIPEKEYHRPKTMPRLCAPTIFDMNGSVPIHDGQSTVRPDGNLGLALKALRESWESVPQVTFDFLDSYREGGKDLLGYMPESVLGNEYALELNRPHSRVVGRVFVLQEPQLKARIAGNPNRITQVTLDPLKTVYMTAVKALPSDCTFRQESGVHWVQAKLRQGIELAGSDLTSASDLLDVRGCLYLIDSVFGFSQIIGYKDFEDYFLEVSRSEWFCPALNSNVKWEQGDVLGTGPSFGVLTLANNCAAMLAWIHTYIPDVHHPKQQIPYLFDSFRVIGDDIIMRSEMQPQYEEIIRSLGGEINHSKTLTSNLVAEFAGRIITPNLSLNKAIKFSDPSDNSFMSYIASLGDQAKYLLKPRQRRVYDFYRMVPGIAVEGPWMQDSFGVPFSPRYQWYLEEVQPALSAAEPDLSMESYEMTLLKATLEAGETTNLTIGTTVPFVNDGYLPSETNQAFRVGGDPRLVKGQALVDALNKHIKTGSIQPFEDWYEENFQTKLPSEELGDGKESLDSDSSLSEPPDSYGLEDDIQEI